MRHGPRSNAESYSVDKVAAKLVTRRWALHADRPWCLACVTRRRATVCVCFSPCTLRRTAAREGEKATRGAFREGLAHFSSQLNTLNTWEIKGTVGGFETSGSFEVICLVHLDEDHSGSHLRVLHGSQLRDPIRIFPCSSISLKRNLFP